MKIKYTCPACVAPMTGNEKHQGKIVKCPNCKKPFRAIANNPEMLSQPPVIRELESDRRIPEQIKTDWNTTILRWGCTAAMYYMSVVILILIIGLVISLGMMLIGGIGMAFNRTEFETIWDFLFQMGLLALVYDLSCVVVCSVTSACLLIERNTRKD